MYTQLDMMQGKHIRWSEFPKSKHYSNSTYEKVIAQRWYAICEYLVIARFASNLSNKKTQKENVYNVTRRARRHRW